MQFANNLALEGICRKPTIDEMSDWISRHTKLGAYQGLLLLGFNLKGRDWVEAAFRVVYTHLDK
ncbi:hypothetical protein, partial [Staphylococcus aureus]|uniref:hypothetical protein n=1 Tax=Staphylococcus aureus TaxID=1280 RepID=UPI001EE6EEDE